MDLLFSEIQGCLVIRPARVDNHTMNGTLFLDYPVNGRRDVGFLGDVRLNGLELAWMSLLRCDEGFTRLGVVDRVDD